MAKAKEEYLEELSDAVVFMEDEEIVDLVIEYHEAGFDTQEGIDGLIHGIMRVSDLYDEEEYYIPELILCADVMQMGIDQFQTYIPARTQDSYLGTVVIGVPEGDTHDIGKGLVKIMLESGNFKVVDIGRDVPLEKFIEAAEEHDAKVIGLSTLMSTTMPETRRFIKILEERNLRDKYKVIVGGAPVSQEFADQIGADGYTESATEVVGMLKELLDLEAV